MVGLGKICLAIWTKNGTEISICGIEIFYILATFEPQQITAECKLWDQHIYLVYMLTYYSTTRTRCNLRDVVSNGTCGRDIFVAYERRVYIYAYKYRYVEV